MRVSKKYALLLDDYCGLLVIYMHRFIHQGVVDYVAWHCGFNFAVFNYADVMIDLGVGIILLLSFLEKKESKELTFYIGIRSLCPT